MKKIVTMQDISCIGKCSVTAAFPVLSAMGIETALLPTAVLSAHTMFRGVVFHDLTDQIRPIMAHWKKEGFRFDGVYTGYLGSFEQLSQAEELFETFGKDGLKMTDPAMGDDGRLYTGFDRDFALAMAGLCGKADIICPNLTEACFMLDIPFPETYTETEIRDILKKLTDLGCAVAVLTGISYEKGKTGAVTYNKKEDSFVSFFTDEQPRHFHGTGDLWAGCFFGALIRGESFADALRIACLFTAESIRLTLAEKDHNLYGVNYEQAIPYLINTLL